MPVDDKTLTIPQLAQKAYLNVSQRKEIEKSITDTKAILDNPALIAQSADEEALHKQYERETAMLESGSPPRYDSNTKNKLFRLLKHIDQDAKSTMLTHTEMERGRPSDIDRYFHWHYGAQNGDQKMLARRNILLALDPDNDEPNFLSITRLREQVDEAHRVNSPIYRMNFDEIKWEESIEESLIHDMDPQEWQTFLELKVLDWTKPTICKELSWSPKQYEAALEKLRQSRYKSQEEQQERIFDELDAVKADNNLPAWVKKTEDAKPWPLGELDALQVKRSTVCKALNITPTTLYKYTKGTAPWPRVLRLRMENFLEKARAEAPETLTKALDDANDAQFERRHPRSSEPSDRFQTIGPDDEDVEPEDDDNED